MAETAIVFSPKFFEHNTGIHHPETSKRLKAIVKELEKLNLFSAIGRCRLVEPDVSALEDLRLVHEPEHIQLVKRICELGGGLLDLGDTVVSPESFEVASYAVGGAIKAVDLVATRKAMNAFAFVRPPGHHAGSNYSAGFCVFNNVAVAAAHLIERCCFERVLILDVDAHHGNGTQEIFYDTKKVLYISLHEDPRGFPGTGFVDEIGDDEGLGHNVNIPFPFGIGDKTYLKAFDGVVVPIVQQYAPQFILVSVGFDGYYADPVARLNLSSSCYALIFERILSLASTLCEDRFAAMLEGGYNLRHLGKLAALTVSKMVGLPYSIKDERCPVLSKSLDAQRLAEKIVEEVKRVQSAFWKLAL